MKGMNVALQIQFDKKISHFSSGITVRIETIFNNNNIITITMCIRETPKLRELHSSNTHKKVTRNI